MPSTTLPELQKFFSDAERMNDGTTFINLLRALLPSNIIDKRGDDLCDEIHNLRTNSNLMRVLLSNWQLAEIFLNAIIANASAEKKQVIKNSRFRTIYHLNQLRRAAIPQDLRLILPIRLQQNIVRQALVDHNAERGAARVAAQPIVLPVLQASERTQMIERLDVEAKIEIPNELICPLSQQMFVDPVKVVEADHVYYFEREFIKLSLQQKSENPLTRRPLTINNLVDAPEKKAEVEAYKCDIYARIKNSASLMNIEKHAAGSNDRPSGEEKSPATGVDPLVAQVNTKIITPLQNEVNRLKLKMEKADRHHVSYQNRIDAFNLAITKLTQSSVNYANDKEKAPFKSAIMAHLTELKENPNIVKYNSYKQFFRGLLNAAISIFTGILPAAIKYGITGSLFFSIKGRSKDTAVDVFKDARSMTIN